MGALGLVALRARGAAKNSSGNLLAGLKVIFIVDGGEGAQEQIADVGQNGGATRSDLVLGKEPVQFSQGIVDARRGLKVFGLAGKSCGEIGEFAVPPLEDGVTEAETGSGVRDGKAATATTGGAMLAMKRTGVCQRRQAGV